ncbi:MAG TPA: thioredoxin-like domain-containing protein [Gemmataceae bacterium]|nr:thioredoxin-like domain-containing protein [Gemmataceae bacterium]
MSEAPTSPAVSLPARRLTPRWLIPALLLGAAIAGLILFAFFRHATAAAQPPNEPPKRPRIPAPELDGGVAWLNTAGPLKLKDLRGKIVVLDFWTLCCINCLHTLPDLAKLEKKYANELVVVGVHSPKFDEEKSTEAIRKAILRYEVSHPVVNDANQTIWNAYDAQSWPTIVLIDPEGNLVARGEGEGLYTALDERIADLVKEYKEKKLLDEKPRKFELARFAETAASPLFFPGKVLADEAGKRLFIADSTHHRIVVTDLSGKKIAVVGDGQPGPDDGAFNKARFNDPQGMALDGETLYVADRKNNLIRALDLKAKTVHAVAGTGEQGDDREADGPALKTALNSPWDLQLHDGKLYVAMAGFHQIWALDLAKGEIGPYAGVGMERRRDGSLTRACFAQPSGLTTDGTTLYVADSEVSSVRAVPLDGKGEVKTIVGDDLFVFGDVDGVGDEVRLQHALGVAWADGKLYVADTYNSKIKVIDPRKRSCTTFQGGEADGWLATPVFSEPGGISVAAGKLYVADTNAHRIRVVDLKTRAVSTLTLQGVEAPK